MKTKFMFLVFLVCMGLVSCDKKTVCECTVSVTIMGQTVSQTASGEIDGGDCKDIPEIKEAEEALAALGALGGGYKIDCKEK
jgi:hypothetical protein